MDEWLELFKQNPIAAIVGVIGAGTAYWWKNRDEKQQDNREVTRLTEALSEEREARLKAEEARDEAIAKQIEQVERFSEMRAQNERMLERMAVMVEQNQAFKATIEELTAQVNEQADKIRQLENTIRVSNL